MAQLIDRFPWPLRIVPEILWWLAVAVKDLAVHISLNVAELGWWWVVGYWLLVLALFDLGGWGWEASNKALRGNDILEVRYAGWLGGFTAFVLRAVVRGRTWPPTVAVYIGWPGCAALLAVGILWRWLFIVPPAIAAQRMWAVRQARLMAERRALP